MLVALFTFLFLGGGGNTPELLANTALLQDRAETVITDSPQRNQALVVLKSMKNRTEARYKMARNTAEQLGALLGDHGVSDAELDTVWTGYMQGIQAYHRDMIDLRFDLKQHVSREEWEAIFADQ